MSRSRGLHGPLAVRKYYPAKSEKNSIAPVWDHNNTHMVPGYFISEDEQCRFYHKGKQGAAAANEGKDKKICQSILCMEGEAI